MTDTTLKAIEAATGGTNLGAIAVMQGVDAVKIGKTHIVDIAGDEVLFAKDATVAAVATSLGTDGESPPSIAGTGVRGWLRAIYDVLNIRGSGAGTNAQRVQLADESLAALENIQVQSSALPTGAATEATVAGIRTDLGTDGGQAPANGTGVRGWLRSIFDRLAPVAVVGSGAGATAQRVHLSDEALAALETISALVDFTKVNGAAHSAGNPLFADITDRTARLLGVVHQGSAGAQAWPVFLDAATLAALETIQVGNFPVTQQIAGTVALDAPSLAALEQITATLTGPGTSEASPIYVFERPANLKVKQVSAANTAQTVTLPAVAGQFHYIVGIHVARYNSTATAVAAAAANLAVTTSNLGGLEWRRGNAVAAGAGDDFVNWMPSNPVKSDTVNTATTVVVPALGAGIISVVNVIYFTAP